MIHDFSRYSAWISFSVMRRSHECMHRRQIKSNDDLRKANATSCSLACHIYALAAELTLASCLLACGICSLAAEGDRARVCAHDPCNGGLSECRGRMAGPADTCSFACSRYTSLMHVMLQVSDTSMQSGLPATARSRTVVILMMRAQHVLHQQPQFTTDHD